MSSLLLLADVIAIADQVSCAPFGFDSPESVETLQPGPEVVALRFADEFVEINSQRLPQLRSQCQCTDGQVMSLDAAECRQIYQSVGEALTKTNRKMLSSAARISPLTIQLTSSELLTMQVAMESQLQASREIFQALSGGEEMSGRRLTTHLKLPPAFESEMQELLEATRTEGGRSVLVRHSNLADYPYFSGIHAMDWRSQFNAQNPDAFAVWPHSKRGVTTATALKLGRGFGAKSDSEQATSPGDSFARNVASAAQVWTGKEGESVILQPDDSQLFGDRDHFLVQTGLRPILFSEIRQAETGALYFWDERSQTLKSIVAIVSAASDDELLQSGETLDRESRPMLQQFVDNVELSRQLNMRLAPRIWYHYVFDQAGNVAGVRTNDNGQPLLQKGRYSRFENSGIDFHSALVNRQVYFSNLGLAAVRHPAVTHALNRVGAYRACLKVSHGSPSRCAESQKAIEISSLTPMPKYRVDSISRSGKSERFDFAQMLLDARLQAILSSRAKQERGDRVVVLQRGNPLIARDIIDGGDGESILVDRVAALRAFAGMDADGRVIILSEYLSADLAPVSSDDVGYGTPGPVVAKVIVQE